MTPVIQEVNLLNAAGAKTGQAPAGGPLSIELRYEHTKALISPRFGVMIESMVGDKLALLQSSIQSKQSETAPPSGTVRVDIDSLPLVPGLYKLTIGCSTQKQQLDLLERAITLDVVDADYFGTGRVPRQGYLLINCTWDA